MELGGSEPFIVMPSVDLDEAIKTAAQSGHPLREAARRY
jgi:acyl-CoA reductase-like NAD-dependent aldehyde dehydrogenase